MSELNSQNGRYYLYGTRLVLIFVNYYTRNGDTENRLYTVVMLWLFKVKIALLNIQFFFVLMCLGAVYDKFFKKNLQPTHLLLTLATGFGPTVLHQDILHI